MQNNLLTITNLHVRVDEKPILTGFNMSVARGEIHALMGVNGSGKSTLVYTLMGHPRYQITQGEIMFNGVRVHDLSVDKRAKLGLFALFQYPVEIPGLSIPFFLKESYQAITGTTISAVEFTRKLEEAMDLLGLDRSFLQRSYNEGFSGGEKKRLELLQALLVKPKLLLMDEIDSGLDIDALKLVATTLQRLMQECPQMSLIVITHYSRILQYIRPDAVHVVAQGSLVHSGGPEVADALEHHGYGCVSSL